MPRSKSSERLEAPPRSTQGGGGSGGGEDEGGGDGGGGGRLVKVAFAPNLVEAEMIQGLLAEHGIASLLKRGPGFDVPEFMPVGPRQVFVAEADAALAREVLAGTPGGE